MVYVLNKHLMIPSRTLNRGKKYVKPSAKVNFNLLDFKRPATCDKNTRSLLQPHPNFTNSYLRIDLIDATKATKYMNNKATFY